MFEAIGNWFATTQFYETMIVKDRWVLVARGLGNTLLIAFFAILLGTLIGCILALCKISKNRFLRGVATVYTTVIRGIPLATQLMIFYFVVFARTGLTATVVAIIGFGINSGAYVTEIFRAGIQGVDVGQTEAGRSLGLSKTQTMIRIVLPQAIKAILPTYTSEFIALIKETSIASFITVTDLTKASDMVRNATYDAWVPLFTAAVIYFILTYGLTYLFTILERRLRRSDRG